MTKFLAAVALVLGITAPVHAGRRPGCIRPTASCDALPAVSTAACSSIISSNHIQISTRTVPSSTLIETVTFYSASTTTAVSTSTRTIQEQGHQSPTPVTTTAIDYATEHETVTITISESLTSSTATTTTSTSISILPGFPPETCVAAQRRSVNTPAIPLHCSCFLTTTETAGAATSTTTQTLPGSIVTETSVSETTVTQSLAEPTPTATVPTTATISETRTTTVTTALYTSTYTSVEAVTTTVSAYGDYCASAPTFSDRAPRSPHVLLGSLGDFFGPEYCCRDCFGNQDCVFWAFDASTCYLYFTDFSGAGSGCRTQSCRRGVQDFTLGPADGKTYGLGHCAATNVI